MTLDPSLTATVSDDAVEFTFRVENAGDDPLELRFTSGQTGNVVVSEDGEDVWDWAEMRMFTQAIRDTTLDPGEEIHEEYTWDDPDAGEYVARATLAADRDADAETTFSV